MPINKESIPIRKGCFEFPKKWISRQYLHFAQTEDIWLKSALKGKRDFLLITGSTSRFSKVPPIKNPI
jgi:hypothetical protein